MNNIQLVDVVGQYKKIQNEIDDAIHRVINSGQFILGKEVTVFEDNCKRYLNVQHAIGCASGTDALQIALMALGIGAGDEVITTSFTFVATVETIAFVGATPVYVDVEDTSFNIDVSKIERAITPKTKAILPVHLYGLPANMDDILHLAKKYKLFVIEDAAQAFGSEYKGKKVGGIGHIGCTSFFPSKNLGAFGDGGMIFTNDDEIEKKIRMLINHGSNVRYYHELLGVNSRLDALQAALLDIKLKYLDEWNIARRKNAHTYNSFFCNTSIKTPQEHFASTHIYHQYTIRVERRDALAEYLKAKNIPFGIYYPVPLHRQKAFAHFVAHDFHLPITEHLTTEVISLPMHTELTLAMQEYIASTITEFYR